MSKRFGRNQRRRAREAIAVLTSEAKHYRAAYSMEAGLREYLGKRNAELEEELIEAKDMAHELSILFPAKTMDISSDAGLGAHIRRGGGLAVRAMAPVVPLMLPGELSEVTETLAARLITLPVLLTKVREDLLAQRVHVRVAFNDGSGETGYAINPRDFSQYPKAVMVRRVREIIAPQIAAHLVNQFYK